MLMWKVAATALQEHPLEGNGWNGVPAVYGQAQEDYFAMGDYTETEARVADAPEYVFNEYLQVALAWGIPVLVGACLIIGFSLNRLYENFNYGLYGALLAFLILRSRLIRCSIRRWWRCWHCWCFPPYRSCCDGRTGGIGLLFF